MNSRRLATTVFAALLLPTCAFATHTTVDEWSDLQSRFQSRDAKISALKKSGTLGETYLGYLDAPGSVAGDAQTLMTEENADRKRLYQLIAQKEGVTVEAVAERAARRNFNLAAKGEQLKTPNGWRTK